MELGFCVVKPGLRPGFFIMAILTFIAFLTFVLIILFVAGNAGAFQLVFIELTLVAGIALDLNMLE